jgi:hypothetical protein
MAGNSADPFNYPLDVVVDYAYTLYIANDFNNRVQKYLMGATNGSTVAGDPNGVPGSSSNLLHNPACIIVDSNGDLYISDVGNNRIQFWTNGASTGTTVAGIGRNKKK